MGYNYNWKHTGFPSRLPFPTSGSRSSQALRSCPQKSFKDSRSDEAPNLRTGRKARNGIGVESICIHIYILHVILKNVCIYIYIHSGKQRPALDQYGLDQYGLFLIGKIYIRALVLPWFPKSQKQHVFWKKPKVLWIWNIRESLG